MNRRADILVVDGFPEIASTLATLLEASIKPRPTVASATDGYDALQSIRAGLPQVVLLDLELAGLFAYELARLLRARAGSQPLKIIAMTAHHGRFSAASRSALFDHTVGKPVDLEALLRCLLS